jgi:hypothetical protein
VEQVLDPPEEPALLRLLRSVLSVPSARPEGFCAVQHRLHQQKGVNEDNSFMAFRG